MLSDQRIEMNEAEEATVDELLASGGSVCRVDPGETGALRVEADGHVWLVEEDGSYEEVTG